MEKGSTIASELWSWLTPLVDWRGTIRRVKRVELHLRLLGVKSAAVCLFFSSFFMLLLVPVCE